MSRGLFGVASLSLRVVLLSWALAGPSPALGSQLFLVAENPSLRNPCFHCDSYVVPFCDPETIAWAREVIARRGAVLGSIVVANIAKGADGINRDYLAPSAPEWSWHVIECQAEFAEGTIEITDGWPGYVESDVDGWIANTRGEIGFNNYTVVAELPEPSRDLMFLCAAGTLVLVTWVHRRCVAGSSPRLPLPLERSEVSTPFGHSSS